MSSKGLQRYIFGMVWGLCLSPAWVANVFDFVILSKERVCAVLSFQAERYIWWCRIASSHNGGLASGRAASVRHQCPSGDLCRCYVHGWNHFSLSSNWWMCRFLVIDLEKQNMQCLCVQQSQATRTVFNDVFSTSGAIYSCMCCFSKFLGFLWCCHAAPVTCESDCWLRRYASGDTFLENLHFGSGPNQHMLRCRELWLPHPHCIALTDTLLIIQLTTAHCCDRESWTLLNTKT